MTVTPPLLRVQDLHVSYREKNATRAVVRGIGFEVPYGSSVGLVGESGSGKSTVARALVGLVRADSGHAWLDDTDLLALTPKTWPAHRRRVQLVFQDTLGALNPSLPVRQILTEPLRLHEPALDHSGRDQRIQDIMTQVDLDPLLLDRCPSQLSGGQRQRVGLGRALLTQPVLLICDEPVSALDVSVQARVLNLLQDIQDAHKLSLLLIAHDLAVVEHLCDFILVMQEGEIVEAAPATQLTRQPHHPYTQQLLASVPAFQRPPSS